MQQITSHVDWSLSVLMSVIALFQFVIYSIRIYEHRVMSALIYLGVACVSVVTAAGISLPRLMNEGTGIASLPVLACLALGVLLMVVGFVGSIPNLVGKYLPRLGGKHSAAASTASHD